MLDRKELKEIAQVQDAAACCVSLYLNVSPVTNPKGEFIIQFKNMVKKTVEGLDKNTLKIIKEDLAKIESYVQGNKRLLKKGLVLLSSRRHDLWRDYHLSVPVKSELVVDTSFSIKPLLNVLDDYERYAVLLVDKESARIFIIHLGEIVEYGEVFTPDVPGRHKKGGWFALSQNHYERHIDYHVGLHLKDVVEKFDSFIGGEQIRRLIIGGSEEAVPMVKGKLHKTVLGNVIGTMKVEMFAKNDEILARSEEIIRSFERQEENETVDRLIGQALKNEKAALGIDDVLHALQTGNVMRLVYVADLNSPGFVCRNCRYPAVHELKACPFCEGRMDRTDYMIDMAAQRAVEQGAEVEAVAQNKHLSDAGGIGAFLRF